MRAASFLARRMAAVSGRRAMSSAHGHGHGHSYPHGMHFHVSPVHKNLALAYGTMLWLWVFWRAKQDGRAVLGLEHPWDHGHGHHGEAHAEAAHSSTTYKLVDGKIKYERSEIGALPTPVEADEEEEEAGDDLHDEDDE
ncbi:hypothetical protein BBO99_00001236 [Phytophthora kernoviae]|uniref:NADH dehydrogenase [ubiquinone] 1 beta subcomplex subunit 2 n=2 Tax=Phytophthora kernoviae TaxID=325452 RepID=A0A3R7I105_9STRA|nr:hypothetical protein G195_005358 [Phytophthora kernoviae 00238/432]KAG2525215.1 hypothetical protein JM16_004551 [Phytophthora kernoviae]KAG2526850.1 hypothetical protein JM18_004127 [Phytophthora kernoviae]RLN14843.1 hypothetical protein BBI17_004643 [Phytophthora kernoviae]RLN84602.1 hypothetical protein BBO99_00001236 [Phytophthora kernoviae]